MTENGRYRINYDDKIVDNQSEQVYYFEDMEDWRKIVDLLNEKEETIVNLFIGQFIIRQHCKVKIQEARERQIPIHKISYGGDRGYWRGYKEALQDILELMGFSEEDVESERFDC